MEAASWLSGLPWSSNPKSVHPAIASVARWVNDSLDDSKRQTLWPLIIESIDTDRPWRPIQGMRLWSRAMRAKKSATRDGDPRAAWESTLAAFREVTGELEKHPPPNRCAESESGRT